MGRFSSRCCFWNPSDGALVERKGWRILLEAFWKEFAQDEAVRLVILTSSYHSSGDFDAQIGKFAKSTLQKGMDELAEVSLLPSGIATSSMPSVYKAANAFVISSRGEGWGRPHCEAMAMGLPCEFPRT